MDISNLDPDLAALLDDIPVTPAAPSLDLSDSSGDIGVAPHVNISDLDPELTALLEDIPVASSAPSLGLFDSIGDDILFSTAPAASGSSEPTPSRVDLTVKEFPKVEHFYRDTPHTYFDSADFYKKVLKNCGETAQRLHTTLTKYLTTRDQKDRSVYRQQLVTNYWQFISVLVIKLPTDDASIEKKYALRYGLVLPTLLTAAQKDIFAKVIDENSYNEAVYYLDEWFHAIAVGEINPSSTDEARTKQQNMSSQFQLLLSKAQGKLQSAENLLRAKSDERANAEEMLKNTISDLLVHDNLTGFEGVKAPFNELQKRGINDVGESLRRLLALDRELTSYLNEYHRVDEDVRMLQEKIAATGDGELNVSDVTSELETVRQMVKMSCGRQGNHFPILSREFFHCTSNEIGIRENVLEIMRWIEGIDCEAYCRQYRSQLNRIPPFVILIPSYGDIGFCWEPFDRYNRVTSRGRIAIPMYTKNLKNALLTATADLRWQVAKEKASYYWMEEGLTGNYYQWFQAQKLKGDVKEYFIEDYLVWMTKESEGIQKLDREVRNVFWRYMPFSKAVKEELKTRAPVYQELCQKDLNRQMSDGY